MSRYALKRLLPALVSVALFLSTEPSDAQEPVQPVRLAPVVTGFGIGDQWESTAHQILISQPEPLLWMMVRPSFEPDYAVEMVMPVEDSSGQSRSNFLIRWRQAKKNIWFASLRPAGSGRLAFHPPIHLETRSKETSVPAEAAQEILKAWLHMLAETRYPKDSETGRGMDGTDYQFYARDPIHHATMLGFTWSPNEGPTRKLVDLGEDLIAYTKAPEKDRPARLAKCVEEAKAIQAYTYH